MPFSPSQDDATLWLLMKQGKEAAFEALYRKYVGDLLHYGEKMGTGEEVLKDLIQDLFIEIWRSRERLSATDSVKFYLFKALRYKMIRHNHQTMSAVPLHGDWSPTEESVESRILNEEQEHLTAKYLHEAIEKLPKRQQEIIHLRFFQGFSNQEIASLMNLQYQSAANLIHRSLQTIRQYIREPILPLLILFLLWS
jgi:RNA polymerase sigma-70 factor (ECF subfamily)